MSENVKEHSYACTIKSHPGLKSDDSQNLDEDFTDDDQPQQISGRFQVLSDSDDQEKLVADEDAAYLFPRKIEMTSEESSPAVPELFTSLPPIHDLLTTNSSTVQDATIQECLPFLSGADISSPKFNRNGVPRLERQKHIHYLRSSLEKMPAVYVGYDANRPWVIYWALTGLCLLGEDISEYKQRVIQTLTPMQNSDGGFSGGHGQVSHCAVSYAAILSLAMIGEAEALESIDRKALWKWLGELKQPDGGFTVCRGGEEDVRGAYCAMVMISLLHLPLELPSTAPTRQAGIQSFDAGLPEYLSRCQTFEGGISDAPGTEAHGAYTFLALACLCILGPPCETLSSYLDLPLLISWLSTRQYAPEGGFAGRTNKLVDGCYSYWIGGCWPLVEAAVNSPLVCGQTIGRRVDSLYSREGLIRYILCCCQAKRGGLRDKPSKHADGYHSCYVLSGLSIAQNHHRFTSSKAVYVNEPFQSAFLWESSDDPQAVTTEAENQIYNVKDRLIPLHPIFVIPPATVERTKSWFRQMTTF